MKFYQSIKFKMSLIYAASVLILCLIYWGIFYVVLGYYSRDLLSPEEFDETYIEQAPQIVGPYEMDEPMESMSVDQFDELTDQNQESQEIPNSDVNNDKNPDKQLEEYYSDLFGFFDKRLPLISFLLALLVSLLSFGFGYVFSVVMFKPLDNILVKMKEVSLKKLAKKVPGEQRKDEFGTLIRNYNEMLKRVDTGYKREKQFIQDASHELKTPLAIMQANLELLQRDTQLTKDEKVEILTSTESSIFRMSKLIKDMLLLERTQLPTTKEIININELLKSVAAESQKLANKSNITVRTFIPDEIVEFCADSELIKRMIENVVLNAINYGRNGGYVEINLAKKGQYDFKIGVKDNGLGISEEDLKNIWDRFYRVDKSRSRNLGGSGLGLSIVKKIADHYMINISVKSQENKGTSFIFST